MNFFGNYSSHLKHIRREKKMQGLKTTSENVYEAEWNTSKDGHILLSPNFNSTYPVPHLAHVFASFFSTSKGYILHRDIPTLKSIKPLPILPFFRSLPFHNLPLSMPQSHCFIMYVHLFPLHASNSDYSVVSLWRL
jgi:hypothetical protein